MTSNLARAKAAEALRRLGHAIVAHDPDDALMERVAEAADRATSMLAETAPRRRNLVALKQSVYEDDPELGERIHHFDECFVSGTQNPLGIGLEVFREGDEVVARVVLGAAFEGAPGRSHGGIVAAIFDDVLGYVLSLIRTPAFTGSLTIDYLAATPIGEPLLFRARLADRDGRKLFIEGECTHDGVLLARARATFIQVDPSRFRP